MPDSKRFESDEVQGPEREARPDESFPPFDDPANSPGPAGSPVQETAPEPARKPQDPIYIYAGHPEFSQDAAKNAPPPSGLGNSERVDDANEKTRHSEGQNPPGASTQNPDVSREDLETAIDKHTKSAGTQ